ncbi:YlxR family protein [bacterium]|nr:YlxR family protein [bacterium]NCQ55770.1 YlxR family protein [Candidatus Parcubacteria bacterium]NCS67719.1 YlxR family protein [Candidatus Peregrinibacteria bacterium]NCS96733.1 YlxR family protein [bacterium]
MERTCLVTKTKAHPSALLRFTVQNGQLVFDETFKASGRGGYVLKDKVALEKLPKLAGKIAYFLKKKKVEVSLDELEKVKAQALIN